MGIAGVARRNVTDCHQSVTVIIRAGVLELVWPHVNDWWITQARVIRVWIVNETRQTIQVGNDTFWHSRIIASVDARRAGLQPQVVVLVPRNIIKAIEVYKLRIGVDIAQAHVTTLDIGIGNACLPFGEELHAIIAPQNTICQSGLVTAQAVHSTNLFGDVSGHRTVDERHTLGVDHGTAPINRLITREQTIDEYWKALGPYSASPPQIPRRDTPGDVPDEAAIHKELLQNLKVQQR